MLFIYPNSSKKWKTVSVSLLIGENNDQSAKNNVEKNISRIKNINQSYKIYMTQFVNDVGKQWFYKYCPLIDIANSVIPADTVKLSFELKGKPIDISFLKKSKFNILNDAAFLALNNYKKQLSPDVKFNNLSIEFKFKIDRKSEQDLFILGSIYLNGKYLTK